MKREETSHHEVTFEVLTERGDEGKIFRGEDEGRREKGEGKGGVYFLCPLVPSEELRGGKELRMRVRREGHGERGEEKISDEVE